MSSRLEKDLEKELGGHKDKIQAYRLVIDVMASLYSDIQHAVQTQVPVDQAIIDRYNQAWVQCYGYLSMLAPQDVMDAYDRLNDYILNILSGRSPLQEWAVTRSRALAFLNTVRTDVGAGRSSCRIPRSPVTASNQRLKRDVRQVGMRLQPRI